MAPDLLNHVRAFEHVGGDMDIILDSGADGSALPLCFGEVGRAVRPGQHVVYVDAQGDPLNIANTRKATVDCGDTSLEEEFLIASVTSPLLSLGRLMKQGWIINTDDAEDLTCGMAHRAFPSHSRETLCAQQSRPLGRSLEKHALPLGPTSRSLWTRLWLQLSYFCGIGRLW